MRKGIFCIVLLIITTALFVDAVSAACEVPATVSVRFLNASGGNMAPRVYVGPSQLQFNDSVPIPLSQNGDFIIDSSYVENVPGIALKRQNGSLRFLLFGNSYFNKEIVGAQIILENATVTGFTNDNSRAVTFPRSLNSLEKQGNGVYILGTPSEDEVFWGAGSRTSSWYSTVAYDNDGFYLSIQCDIPDFIRCSSNSECGTDGYVSSPVCSGSNVTRVYQTFNCNNPGTTGSTCSAVNSTQVVETCLYGCSNGTCSPPVINCSSNSDCGLDGFVDNPFCSGNNVTRTYQTFTCNNPGTTQSSCSALNSTAVVEECNYSCSNGACTQPVVTCNLNSDCGLDGYVGDLTCSGNNVTRLYQTFICNSPGTTESTCSASNSTAVIEQCSYQCVNGACEAESTNYTYVVTYVGDIDGAVSEDWFYFYKQIVDFHDTNQVSCSFSFYPGTMVDDVNYTDAIKKMYSSSYSELIQKGYDGNEDANIDQLTYDQQKAILKKGQDAFRANMSAMLGINPSAVVMLVTDDQIGARFTDVTRQALEDLGFKCYFDVYVGEGLQPVQPTATFDVLQYGVSFTTTGDAGSDTTFKTKAQIINEIKTYNTTDVPLTYINGHLVVPLFSHQQDFESNSNANQVNSAKWSTYTDTMLTLKNDSEIRLVTPKQVYELRHGTLPPPITCSSNSDCGTDGYVGNPTCFSNNVTRIYQIFTCNNPGTNQSTCSASNSTVVIEQCSYQCSAGACQNETVLPQSLCQYAKYGNATSQNTGGSLAIYATGPPDAPSGRECSSFSGYGYDWTPSNWNVKANLTLTYENPVYVNNVTIIGDYDICWDAAWLKNSQTGEMKKVLNAGSNTCVLTINLLEDFQADQVILQTCGWAWCATDAVEMCGTTNQTLPPPPPPPDNVSNVTVCTWKNCRKGAVSVSVDDEYSSCMPELEANGYRGTYFLTETNTYSSALWSEFAAGFNKGHELGTHMQEHWCSEVSDSVFNTNIENNIVDITGHTSATRDDIITHAYPCGFVGANYENLLSSNWNFLSARGYYFNQLESQPPVDFFNLKSLNSHGYPGGTWEPPNYFTTVDNAEIQGKWANLVFHNECSDDGVINYLPSKNVWVDTIGNVVRYIKLRSASQVYNYGEVGNEIRFNVRVTDDTMNASYYRQNLTLLVPLGLSQVGQVQVNSNSVPYTFSQGADTNYVMFDLPFPISADVVITKA